MPPLRRYLRITPHSVLEVRIYLDNPGDASRWLLTPRSPALPRVIEAVRPLVLPKLREENLNNPSKGGKGGGGAGGKKRKGWKDVVVTDEFEVSVFLTETSTRHSILRKTKTAKSENTARLGTTDGKMTGGSRDAPMEIGEEPPGLLGEESGNSASGDGMEGIPPAAVGIAKEESNEQLFVSDDGSSEEDESERRTARGKGKKSDRPAAEEGDGDDDKKKMGMRTTYDGFSIYGRILCLVVKRKGGAKGKGVDSGSGGGAGGQAMMEDWIASTQMEAGAMMDE